MLKKKNAFEQEKNTYVIVLVITNLVAIPDKKIRMQHASNLF